MKKQCGFSKNLLLCCAALAVGEALAFHYGRFAAVWPVAAVLAVLIAIFGYGYAVRGWTYLAIVVVGLALGFVAERTRNGFLERAAVGRGPLVARLVVESDPERRGDWLSFNTVCDGVPLKVIMSAGHGKARPHVGETWECAGWLERRDRSDRRRRTLWVKGRVTYTRRIETAAFSYFRRSLARFRRKLSTVAGHGLGHAREVILLNRAILLGERARLPREERETFIAAGTMHVFAISGLHVMVIAKVILVLLTFAFVPFRLASALLIPILWTYVLMIGSPPSAVRAATMASFYFAAPVFWRRSNALVAWGQTFLLFHVIDPGKLLEVGSLLSFSVMFGILLFVRWARDMRLPRPVEAVGVAAAAWAAGVPIAAQVFERITPGGLFANLALVPIAAVDVTCGALGLLFGTCCPWLGSHFNNAAALMTDAMRGISTAVASIPGANVETGAWTPLLCFGWYSVIFLSLWLVRSVCLRRRDGILAL